MTPGSTEPPFQALPSSRFTVTYNPTTIFLVPHKRHAGRPVWELADNQTRVVAFSYGKYIRTVCNQQ